MVVQSQINWENTNAVSNIKHTKSVYQLIVPAREVIN